MPLDPEQAVQLCYKRHPEWLEFQKCWRRLQDSLEGGQRYQQANYYYDPTLPQMPEAVWPTYGYDPPTGQRIPIAYGQIVDRNLIPHLSEMSDAGKDVYVMRLERTPVPRIVSRIVNCHISKIFRHEVRRTGDTDLTTWWENVDGSGTSIDKWLRKTIAPLFLVCGHLDIVFDYPKAPEGVAIESRADEIELGLNQPFADYILPENMLWWRLDRFGRYEECLVFERTPVAFNFDKASKAEDSTERRYQAGKRESGGPAGIYYRHYTRDEITLYEVEGEPTTPSGPGNTTVEVKETRVNPFGFVPITRLFDTKKTRCKNTGQSRYEGIAELMRAVYNTRSEVILNDVFHSHPNLEGPEDYIQGEGKIKVGPDGVLPMKKSPDGGYQGWDFVEPPQSPAESLVKHCEGYSDEADRLGGMLKPAGQTTGTTVSQSGVSKQMDHVDANDVLSEIAETLCDSEKELALLFCSIPVRRRLLPTEIDSYEICYPREFKLDTAADLAALLTEVQGLASAAGDLPEVEQEFLERIYTLSLPGLDDKRAKELVAELETFLERKAKEAIENAEARQALALIPPDTPLMTATSKPANLNGSKSESKPKEVA